MGTLKMQSGVLVSETSNTRLFGRNKPSIKHTINQDLVDVELREDQLTSSRLEQSLKPPTIEHMRRSSDPHHYSASASLSIMAPQMVRRRNSIFEELPISPTP